MLNKLVIAALLLLGSLTLIGPEVDATIISSQPAGSSCHFDYKPTAWGGRGYHQVNCSYYNNAPWRHQGGIVCRKNGGPGVGTIFETRWGSWSPAGTYSFVACRSGWQAHRSRARWSNSWFFGARR